MTDILNFPERAVALLAAQFQTMLPTGLTNFQNLIYGLNSNATLVNTQEQNLINLRWLNTAQGVQLDGIGQIVGLPRVSGQTDLSYQEDLQFQIFFNSSEATPEEVIYILKYITKASEIWYNEVYPAAYQMATNGLYFPPNPSDLVNLIQQSSPAGVNFLFITATYGLVPLSFSTDPILEQLYVSPNPSNPNNLLELQVNPGSGLLNFTVNAGSVFNPDFGGHFAEGYSSGFIDVLGAGILPEAIQG